MGLFGSSKRGDPLAKAFNPYEAVCGVLLSVVASDGDVADDETDGLVFVVNRHPIFADQSVRDFEIMIEEQFSILTEHGWEVFVEKAASHVPSNLSGTVFALAVDFVMAGDQVESAKESLIESLRRMLRIGEAEAKTVVQVMALKNGVYTKDQ